ncbi:hypothetical protein EMGBS2_01540 [Actinomycetota bacterium]|nr:hypothetical protein EMGBS2_01540 [Actinomycetota bacterium]
MLAGADFIKTSTGKVAPAATAPVVLVMLEAVRDYLLLLGKKLVLNQQVELEQQKMQSSS